MSLLSEEQKKIYNKWKELVNMTARELEVFLKSSDGKRAGLSKEEAEEKGIRSGRDSGRAIVRMKNKGVDNWTKKDWEWAQAQINFLSRSLGQYKATKKRKGKREALYEDDGDKTRLHLALLVWGHNPMKYWG